MNIVLRNPSGGRDEFFIACIKKNGAYYVYGRYVSPEGKLRTMSKCGPFDTVSAATDRCRSLARNKVRKKGFEKVSLDEVPDKVAPYIEMPTDMQMTPQELIRMVQEARRERYVIFKNVQGLEEFFDVDVEYLAKTTDEEDVLAVYDRFGGLRKCFIERMKSVVPTDEAKKAEGMKKL